MMLTVDIEVNVDHYIFPWSTAGCTFHTPFYVFRLIVDYQWANFNGFVMQSSIFFKTFGSGCQSSFKMEPSNRMGPFYMDLLINFKEVSLWAKTLIVLNAGHYGLVTRVYNLFTKCAKILVKNLERAIIVPIFFNVLWGLWPGPALFLKKSRCANQNVQPCKKNACVQ